MKMLTLPKALVQMMLLVMAGGAAFAQNSDLGLLLGVIAPGTQTQGSASGANVNTDVGAALQINYAYQLKGWEAGDLYLEVPLFLAGRGGVIVARPGSSSVKFSGIGAITPGIRFKMHAAGRVYFYVAAGGGVGWVQRVETVAAPGTASVTVTSAATGAFDFGGGLDFRLTRLLSLKGEIRDLVTTDPTLPNSRGHNNPIIGFGLAFHF